MVQRLLLALTLLLAPGVSSAIPVDLFHSPGDDGSGPSEVRLAPGVHTLNLWADPTAAGGGGVYGIQDIRIQATGTISVVDFSCDSGADCLAGVPGDPATQVLFTAGDDINGDFAAFEIATVTLNVELGVGLFAVISGTALDGNFGGGNLDLPNRVAYIPEPGTTILLALGLFGLGFQGRRRVR